MHFGGIISLLLITIRWFMGVLGDHDCESTLFWFIFGLEAKSCVCKGYTLEHHDGVKRVECR